MQPLVSILIPAYNAEKWLKETLESAANQTWPRKEIIVVDDGSTDGTFTVANSLNSSLIKVVRQENRGACAARNAALRLAQGDYLQWLDADDLLHPQKIALQMEQAEKDPRGRGLLSSCFGIFFYRWRNAEITPNSLWEDLLPVEWFLHKFQNDDAMFPAVWLVSRQLSNAAGDWDERLTLDDDGEYFARIVAASEAVRFVPEAVSFYRQANFRSISKTINHRTCTSLALSYKLCIGYMLALENSERTRAAAVKYLQTNLIYFYPEEKEIVQELMELASTLGGTLSPPDFSRKYSFIVNIFGLRSAKRVAAAVRGLKQRALITHDQMLHYLSTP